MAYTCELTKQEHQPTLTVRTRTAVEDLPQVLGRVYGEIGAYLSEMGERPAGPPFAAYYNLDMDDMDVEIGFPVPEPLPDKTLDSGDEIKSGEMPEGDLAVCHYVGPYDKISTAYDALSRWVQQQGRKPTGVVYEVYLSDPSEIESDELQTQILFPLK